MLPPKSIDLLGTPRFTLAFLKECMEDEREAGEFMKRLLHENRHVWTGERIDRVEKIIQEHRNNYKKLAKQIDSL